jgi:hypothetical protein
MGHASLRRWKEASWEVHRSGPVGTYVWERAKGSFMRHGVNALTLHGARIDEIAAFLTRGPWALRSGPTRWSAN